jgi:hypothetical protein
MTFATELLCTLKRHALCNYRPSFLIDLFSLADKTSIEDTEHTTPLTSSVCVTIATLYIGLMHTLGHTHAVANSSV